jgi:hypothetical protein
MFEPFRAGWVDAYSIWSSIGTTIAAKRSRRRWQIELRAGDEEALDLACRAFGVENESQAGRELLGCWKRAADAICDGR